MKFRDFYEIACYGNENWNQGNFTTKEVAEYAYDYLSDFQYSKENGVIAHNIKELYKLLIQDGTENGKDWAYQIAMELDLVDIDFMDYMETDAEIVMKFLDQPKRKMNKLKYANTEINFTVERLVEIATHAIDELREYDEELAMECFRDTMGLSDYEREFFGVPADEENEEDDSEPWFCDYDMEEPWDYEERNYQKLYHSED